MNIEKIKKFIDKQNVSFICSIDENNYPNMKAMLKPRKRNGLKEFYFSTNTSEYSYAMKSQFRNIGNQMSGTGNHQLLSASLLAHVFI